MKSDLKSIGHDFFSNFPKLNNKYVESDLIDLLYYGVEWLRLHEDKKLFDEWYYDFLNKDLKSIPQGENGETAGRFNLFRILKMISKSQPQ